MSKDFEQAYRELAESEIPDLWERIEHRPAGHRRVPIQREKNPFALYRTGKRH